MNKTNFSAIMKLNIRKRSFYYFSISICFFIFSNTLVFAQPGSLDASFGGTGIVTTDIGFGNDRGFDVIQQADGRLLVAGLSGNGANNDFAVVRYNIDGSLDNTFGVSGMTSTPIGPGNEQGQSIAIQTDNQIIVAGFASNGTNNDFALVRYNFLDGTLDNTFGVGGIVTTAVGAGIDQGHSVALQLDGKIVVAGFSNNGLNHDFAITRYLVNGSLDTTFDTDGIVTTDFLGSDDVGRSVAIQTDGKIVVTGWTFNGTDFDFAIARYNTNGSLDNSFDLDGKATTNVGVTDDQGYSVHLQLDGKLLVAGSTFNGANLDFATVRYNTDGSLDLTYDTDGIVTTDFFGGDDLGYSVNIQTDGKILMAGVGYNITNKDFCLARYNSDGSLDISFDTDGKVNTDLGGGNDDTGWSVEVQSDDRVVVTGNGSVDGVTFEFGTVRYNICEILDTSITQTGATLSANGLGNYQWINCDSTFSIIPGATNQDYIATSNGNYAVIISMNFCEDTSSCYMVNSVGIENNNLEHTILVYPNPTEGQLMISLDKPLTSGTIQLVSVTGQVVKSITQLNGTNFGLDISSLTRGIYFLQITEGNYIARSKIIKK